MSDLLRSTAVLSKLISALVLSLKYLNHLCPLPHSFSKEILPHPCHHLPFARRTGTHFLPYILSCMFFRAPPQEGGLAAGPRITATPRKTAKDDGEKNQTSSRECGDEIAMRRITFQGIKPRQQLYFLCRKDQTPSSLAK